ncbi:NAD(P)-dependent alcohol dehydrogenase [Pendulispora brunnea]|uniref:NAD(P)-dependent alcohol dehydrogenase n=1 Tax=Pendulispora brunnea TaxID=2905690 RepID=A0ABZ2KJZ8_9BACT
MKAYELQPKEGFDALTLVELAERKSRVLAPNDIRVRVRAVSLNYRDLVIARSAAQRSEPIVPTSDGAGEVLEVGSAVSRWKKGDRVAANFFPTWIDGEFSGEHHPKALGGGQDGMLAEEVVLHESAWVRIPEHLSFEEASTLPCAGVTAFNALFRAASLQAGDTVLVQGTGGVSIFALQLAKAAGARVILTSSSADKRERAKQLGADHVLDYKANPKWGEAALAWTQGRGVDIAVEVGGPGTFDQSVAALRYGGTMSLLGVLTGTKGEVNTYALFHKTARVAGVYVGSVAMFDAFNRALSASSIKPIIDRTYAFDQARQAYEHLASGQHFGKVVIRL